MNDPIFIDDLANADWPKRTPDTIEYLRQQALIRPTDPSPTTAGGKGSGDYGHSGRPKQVGGSGPGGGDKYPTVKSFLEGRGRKGDAQLNKKVQKDWEKKLKKNYRDNPFDNDDHASIIDSWGGSAHGMYIAKQMTKVMADAPKYRGIVYRGSESHPFKNVKAGQTINLKRPVPSSRDPHQSREFVGSNSQGQDKGTFMRVQVRTGVAIERLSGWKSEREVVMPAGRYKVVKAHIGKNLHIIELKER
jgi:hypothetical protein